MVGWNHAKANWKLKNCLVCKTEFTPKSGVHKFCSEPCKGKWKYISGKETTEKQYKEISGNWIRYLSRLLYYDGRKRDQLTREILLKKLEQQGYRCALSGVQLTCNLEKGVKSFTNASVDQIVPQGGYTEDNIQLVCRALNSWRADVPMDQFIWWCQQVVNHNRPERTEVQDGQA